MQIANVLRSAQGEATLSTPEWRFSYVYANGAQRIRRNRKEKNRSEQEPYDVSSSSGRALAPDRLHRRKAVGSSQRALKARWPKALGVHH